LSGPPSGRASRRDSASPIDEVVLVAAIVLTYAAVGIVLFALGYLIGRILL
jgi:hypothetical protein